MEVNTDVFDCLLLSIDFFTKGLGDPEHYYSSGIHGVAKLIKAEKGISDKDIPYHGEGGQKELLVKLHFLREFKIGYQFQYTGLPNMEIFEMVSEHFFIYPDRLKQTLPEVYEYMMDIYHQDPLNPANPVIQTAGH